MMHSEEYFDTRLPTGWSDAQENHLYNVLRQAEPLDLLLQRRLQQQNGDDENGYNFSKFILPDEAREVRENELMGYPVWAEEAGESYVSPIILEPDTDPDNRLGHVFSRFALTVQERQVLVLTVLGELDVRYQHLMGFLQNSSTLIWPGKEFICTLFCADVRARCQLLAQLEPDAPLFRHRLLTLVNQSDEPISHSKSGMLRIDPAVFRYLMGNDALPVELSSCAEWLKIAASAEQIQAEFVQSLGTLTRSHQDETLQITLMGKVNDCRSIVAGLAARSLSKCVLTLDLSLLPTEKSDALDTLVQALRANRLGNGLLLLSNLSALEEAQPTLMAALSSMLSDAKVPFYVLQDEGTPPTWLRGISQTVLSAPPLSQADGLRILAAGAQPYAVTKDMNYAELLANFSVNPATIDQIFREADVYRRQTSTRRAITTEELSKAFRFRAQQDFGKLATRIEPVRTFDDLVAGQNLIEELDDILNAVQQRQATLDSGFKDKIFYGTGLSALFYGDSGTGKSMAAEVLAKEMGRDLIKVDLANVVNKYIGETEKNLARVFDLAIRDAGVLFFDEADALFGKRSEVSDAHDRHANIEVSYLLQRLESYPGLVILATNNRHHLDDAFTRRFTFITRFTMPDISERLKMWQRIWPANVQLSADVSLADLAQEYVVTGASIRNIALLSSWLALGDGAKAVGIEHITRAVARELSKSGRII